MSSNYYANNILLAYLIHAKPYRNTSLLIDFFTKEHGFIKAIAKGVRSTSSRASSKKLNKMGLLQPFCLLYTSFYGRSSLLSLNNVELAEQPCNFNNNRYQLSVGYYINELLYYLCAKSSGIVYDNLFDKYNNLLVNLSNYYLSYISESNQSISNTSNIKIEILLREFELDLLDNIGYGLRYDNIDPDLYYSYNFEEGFYIINNNSDNKILVIKGNIILNIKNKDWADQNTLIVTKKLLRNIINFHVGNKKFYSRDLLII